MNLLKHQQFKVENNILYQVNKSAIKLEKNRINSCIRNSSHIDIEKFFIKDRIDKKEMMVEYCPTYHMLADYFTKMLQGLLTNSEM